MPHVSSGGTPTENGTALQNAITAAALGDTITLDAGGIYEGNFVIPNKGAGTAYITIRPASLAGLPADGVRITPASIAACPILRTGNTGPVVSFNYNAHHYLFRGIRFTTSSAVAAIGICPVLVTGQQLGGAYPVLETIQTELVFDQCLLHPYEEDPLPYRSVTRAFSIDGANITIKNCSMWDFMGYEPQTLIPGESITNATKANPVVITLSIPWGDSAQPINSDHKWLMSISGATGEWAVLNGHKLATWLSTTTASLEDFDPYTFVKTNINTSGIAASFSGQVPRRLTQVFTQSQGILITQGPGPYLIHNNLIEAQYTQMFTGGGAETMIPAENIVTVTAVSGLDTCTLSGLGEGGAAPLQVGDLISFKYAAAQSVTAADRTVVPCRLTVTAHRYPSSVTPVGGSPQAVWRSPEVPGCFIQGATGEWTVINTSGSNRFWGKIIDATHIDLYKWNGTQVKDAIPFDATALTGSLTGTVTWYPESTAGTGGFAEMLNWQVGRVETINPTTKQITHSYAAHPHNETGGNGTGSPILVGSEAKFNGIPIHDLTVTRNTFRQRGRWYKLFIHIAMSANNQGSGTKGSWETKHATNVLFEGNIMECDEDLEPFDACGTFSFNQSNGSGGTPWVHNSNWIVRSNVFRRVGFFPLTHTEEYLSGIAAHGMLIENNVWTHCNGPWLQMITTTDVIVRHNTIQTTRAQMFLNPFMIYKLVGPIANNIIENNIFNYSLRGYLGGTGDWDRTTTNNYIINNEGLPYPPAEFEYVIPAGDVEMPTAAAMKFVDKAAGDAGDWNGYKLADDSPGHNAATDGGDVGANFAVLNAALGEADDGGGAPSVVTAQPTGTVSM